MILDISMLFFISRLPLILVVLLALLVTVAHEERYLIVSLLPRVFRRIIQLVHAHATDAPALPQVHRSLRGPIAWAHISNSIVALHVSCVVVIVIVELLISLLFLAVILIDSAKHFADVADQLIVSFFNVDWRPLVLMMMVMVLMRRRRAHIRPCIAHVASPA